MGYIDFKKTVWERRSFDDKYKDEVLKLVKEYGSDDSNLFDTYLFNPEDLLGTINYLDVEENEGQATIEVYVDVSNLIWDNRKPQLKDMKKINLKEMSQRVSDFFYFVEKEQETFRLLLVDGKTEMLQTFEVTEHLVEKFIHEYQTNGNDREILRTLIGNWTNFKTKADVLTGVDTNVLVKWSPEDEETVTYRVPVLSKP